MAWTTKNTDNAIQAGGGIASSLINVFGQNHINNRNIEEQRRAQAQAQRNWFEQQEYNSPQNQVARLDEAGLNPDMLYGQSSSGVAGNAATPAQTINPPTLNPYFLDPMTASNISKNISEIAKNKADAKKSNSEANLADKQALTEEEKKNYQNMINSLTHMTLDDQANIIRNNSASTAIGVYRDRLKMNDDIFNQCAQLSLMGIPYNLSKDKDAGTYGITINDWKGTFLTAKGEKFLDAYWKERYGLPDAKRQEALANAKYFNQLALESETLLPQEEQSIKIQNSVEMFNLILEGARYGIKMRKGADGLPEFNLEDVTEEDEVQAQQWIRTFAGLLNLNVSAVNYQGSGGLETNSTSYDKNGNVKGSKKTSSKRVKLTR